jgi:hypothetical protein
MAIRCHPRIEHRQAARYNPHPAHHEMNPHACRVEHPR